MIWGCDQIDIWLYSRLNNNLMMIEERVGDVLSFYFEVIMEICQHTLENFDFLTELISFAILINNR